MDSRRTVVESLQPQNGAKNYTTMFSTSESESRPTSLVNVPDDNRTAAIIKNYVDIIAQSPYEIVSHIAEYITIETACQCMEVSRVWRNKLMQAPEPWRTVDLRNSMSALKLLPKISPHVQRLVLLGTQSDLAKHVTLLDTHEFSNLRSLTVQIQCLNTLMLLVESTKQVDHICERLYSALKNVAQNLVELDIERRFGKPGISLDRILSTCRNLTTLHITAYNVVDRSLLYKTSLTTVYLNIDDSSIELQDLEPIFSSSPHLRYFELDCNVEDSIIPVIGNHCPNLTTVITNQEYFEAYHNRALRTRIQDGHNADKLHCLVLHYLFAPLPVLSRFQHCQDTLRTLCFAPMDGAPFVDWDRFSSLTLPNLTYLQINTGNTPMHFIRTHLPTMIRSNLPLKTLILQEYYDHSGGTDTAAIYNAITQLPQLICMHLICFGICGNPFLQLLEHLNRKGSLYELEINSCNGASAEVLFCIAKIESLKRLAIKGLDIDVTVDEFEQFLLMGSQHLTQLTSLDLAMMNFNDRDAQVVATFKNLSHLTLIRTGFSSRSIKNEPLSFLRRHIKDVQIISN